MNRQDNKIYNNNEPKSIVFVLVDDKNDVDQTKKKKSRVEAEIM